MPYDSDDICKSYELLQAHNALVSSCEHRARIGKMTAEAAPKLAALMLARQNALLIERLVSMGLKEEALQPKEVPGD